MINIINKPSARQRYQLRHKLKGLCADCSKAVVENKTRCRYHLDKHKEYRRKRFVKNQNEEEKT